MSRMDTTWLQPLVDQIFAMFPDADAYCARCEIMDNDVVFKADRVEALHAIAELKKGIERLDAVCAEYEGVIELRRTTASFANMIRRSLMTRVKVPAFTECHIRRNTSSSTSDEKAAHRFGQLALSGIHEVEFSAAVNVKGRNVLASDICGCAVHDKDVTIVEVDEGEIFEAHLVGRWGSAHEDKHAKFNAVASVAVHPILVCATISSRMKALLKDHNITAQPVTGGHRLRRKDGKMLRREFVMELNPDCVIRTPVDFDVHFESLGQFDAATVFDRARRQLLKEINDLERTLMQ